jgi:hypothetical protein
MWRRCRKTTVQWWVYLPTGKLAETIGNLTEMLLLASARAKKLHEDLE